MKLTELVEYSNSLLNIGEFDDYAPNGLQIEGRAEVNKIATAVTASLAVIKQAIEWQADMLLVHHGYFWKGESPVLQGIKGKRVKQLLKNNISLVGYHLPLDAHSELGNNAIWGQEIGVKNSSPISNGNLVWQGELDVVMTGSELACKMEKLFGRVPLHIQPHNLSRKLKSIAWCSGGAQSYLEKIADYDIDAFLTGEASEYCFHIANELNIDFFSCGHHATEKFGITALGEHLADKFAVDVMFIDENNPI